MSCGRLAYYLKFIIKTVCQFSFRPLPQLNSCLRNRGKQTVFNTPFKSYSVKRGLFKNWEETETTRVNGISWIRVPQLTLLSLAQ